MGPKHGWGGSQRTCGRPPHPFPTRGFLCFPKVQPRCSQPCCGSRRPDPYRQCTVWFSSPDLGRSCSLLGGREGGAHGPSSLSSGGPFLVRPLQKNLTDASTAAGGSFSFPPCGEMGPQGFARKPISFFMVGEEASDFLLLLFFSFEKWEVVRQQSSFSDSSSSSLGLSHTPAGA